MTQPNFSSPPTPPGDAAPSLLTRIAIAFGAFFAVLGDADAALRVQAARDGTLPASFPAHMVPKPCKEQRKVTYLAQWAQSL